MHDEIDDTVPFIKRFKICSVPAVLVAPNPNILNFKVAGAFTVNGIVQLKVEPAAQLADGFAWLDPWSTQVVPPSILYANRIDTGPEADLLKSA